MVSIKRITSLELAALVAQKWKKQYNVQDVPEWRLKMFGMERCEIAYKELVALGVNPSPEDVDRVIGNNSWTRLSCDNNCGNPDSNSIWTVISHNYAGVDKDNEEGEFGRDMTLCEACAIKLTTDLMKMLYTVTMTVDNG